MNEMLAMRPGWAPALYDFTRRKTTVRVRFHAAGFDPGASASAGQSSSARFGVRVLTEASPDNWRIGDTREVQDVAGDPEAEQWIDLVVRVPRKAERIEVYADPGLVKPRYAIEVLDASASNQRSR